MIRSPLGLRLDPAQPLKEQFQTAARLGAKGVVVDAAGELGPGRLSETGRREFRHALRSTQLNLFALHLPTRRPFDTLDQLDDRLRRADLAFELAYDLGTTLLLARVGAVPPESDAPRREVFCRALSELGRRADRRGVRLAVETGAEAGSVLREVLDAVGSFGLAASLDPSALLRQGLDPVVAVRDLGSWVAHAYAGDASASIGGGLIRTPNPRGTAFPPGVLDWEEYLGALEEIDYRGPLTIWPDPARPFEAQFQAVADRLARF